MRRLKQTIDTMTNTKGMMFSGTEQGEPYEAPRSLRIIVADDDQDTVLTLMRVLRHEGHEVRGLHRAQDALHALQDFGADAVLLDIAVPDMSAYEAAREILAHYGERRPLLIAMGGVYKHGSDRILSVLVGFHHHLTEPYEPSDVLKLLAPLTSHEGRKRA